MNQEQLKEKIVEILKNRTWVWSGEFTDKYYELLADELMPLFSQSLDERVKEIEELKGELICDGENGCGGKPPFTPKQQSTCGSSFAKHLILESKYDTIDQVLSILKEQKPQ